jgi:hypothetical protein
MKLDPDSLHQDSRMEQLQSQQQRLARESAARAEAAAQRR